jgi:hypothetical protein
MTPFSRLSLAALLPICALACSHPSQTPTPQTEVGARIAGPLKNGDCVEARRRAQLQADLEVDQLPTVIVMKPAPFLGMPEGARRKDGSAEIKIDVVIDTLGRADMRTFKVVKVSNKWFTENVRGVIGKWKFTPAVLASCKVPRVYHFMSSLPRYTATSQ